MARFIVDVGNLDPKDIKAINELICDSILSKGYSGLITSNCVDDTNENQFYHEFDNNETNELSKKQIENFKAVCNQ